MRTAYKCRAYPDPEQASVLNRTFGCIRVVWNQTLAWRQQRYQEDETGTTYAQAVRGVHPVRVPVAARRPPAPREVGDAAGVHLVLVKDFAVTSGGQRIPNPRHLEQRAINLARYQRRLARCQQGSANRAKAKAKAAPE